MPMQFDGANDVMASVGGASVDNIFAGGGTLMAWIFPIDLTAFPRVFNKASGGAGTDGYSFTIENGVDDRIRFAHGFSTTGGAWVSPTTSIVNGAWQHVAVVYDKDSDANAPVMYIDGALVTTTTDIPAVGTADDDSAEDFVIANENLNDTSEPWDGSIADARAYDRALTAEEIEAIHTSGLNGIVDGLVGRWRLDDTRFNVSGQDFYSGGSTDTIGAALTLTVDLPVVAPAEDGDLLKMVIVSSGDSSGTPEDITTPAGWTLENSGQTDLPATISTPSVWIFTRVASSEPTSYVVTGNQTTTKLGTIMNFKDTATTVDVISSINTGTSSNPVAPSVSPSAPALLVTVVAGDDDDIVPSSGVNFPTGVNGRKTIEATGTGNGCSMLVATELVDAGATGTRTFTFTGSEQWGALSIAFLAGQGATDAYIKDLTDNAAPFMIQSAPIFKEDDSLGLKTRRRAA